MAPAICPNCDAEVPARARACPECGADETTGWSSGAHCERLGIPDPDTAFDYRAFVKDEFGPRPNRGSGLKAVWIVTAIMLLLALLAWAF